MTKSQRFYVRFLRWLVCWLEVFQGLLGIVTLGLYRPSWAYKMVLYVSIFQGRHRQYLNGVYK